MPNGPNLSTLNSDNSPKSTVNSTIQAPIQAPRRKFVGEGRLRKVGSNVLSPFALLNKQINICGIFYCNGH
jgi:anaphase-promoting complex subunit 3